MRWAILCPVPDAKKTIRRRDLLTGLAAGVAGAVAVPDLGAHTTDMAQAQTRPSPSPVTAAPRLLDDHRHAMLDGIAERILPGARTARVADLLDRVLAVEPASAQRRFLNALGAFD